jgi:glycosyltransferase involved in cell wall biosynthesis
MIIHLFAPFFSGSHRRWAEGYARHSQHTIRLFTLPGRHWKWRMHGAAVQLAQEFLAQKEQPDLLLTTDMLDTATFLSLTRSRTAKLPVAVYFHENQLTYPWSPTDEDVPLQRDRHYGWLNYTSALAADTVLFNSNYHQQSFLNALPDYLSAFPDYQGLATVKEIANKSQVLYLGMDLLLTEEITPPPRREPPILLWNHRWEYDKNPDAFFRVCEQLKHEGLQFKLIVLGEQYAKAPPVFSRAREALKDEIIHWGFAKDKQEYTQWLQKATILPVTSNQDFFGGSIVEAMFHGVYPLLPNRLSYPEHIPPEFHHQYLYDTEKDLVQKLRHLLQSPIPLSHVTFRSWVAHYDWQQQAPVYDQQMESIIHQV